MAVAVPAILTGLASAGAGVGISKLLQKTPLTPDTSAQEAEIGKQREQQSISLARQTQEAQQTGAEQDTNVARATRLPRGRRLLLAATGERGVTNKLG